MHLFPHLFTLVAGFFLLGLWMGIALLLAKITDGLLLLVDFALDEGHILSGWYSLVLRLKPTHPKLYKVLGGCIVCCGFWLSLACYCTYVRYVPVLHSIPVLVIYQSLVVGKLVKRVRKAQAQQLSQPAEQEESLLLA
jgi:hypothetical protein